LFREDNTALHYAAIKHQKLANSHSEVPKHQAYQPKLATSNYHLCNSLKKHHKERKFSSTEQATLAGDVLCGTTKRIFLWLV
jgi:hypothetical protein